MMTMLSSVVLYFLLITFHLSSAFVIVKQTTTTTPTTKVSSSCSSSTVLLQATASDAMTSMENGQVQIVDTIASTIPDLASKPDFTWTPNNGIIIANGSGPATLDARDAPGPANIAWLAALYVPSVMSSLTIFNGPLTDVPHFVSKCIVVNDGTSLQFILDFRPRAYGAYEMRRDDGTYPGPDELGRKSFEYSGARNEYDNKFGTDEVKTFIASTISSFDGAVPSTTTNPTELDLLTRGPLYVDVTMPLTDGNVNAIVDARAIAANLWLSWTQQPQHEHRPGAPINSQYVYDTKYKQNAYGALLNEYTTIFGSDDGSKLAVAESGPLDEAYVGGAS